MISLSRPKKDLHLIVGVDPGYRRTALAGVSGRTILSAEIDTDFNKLCDLLTDWYSQISCTCEPLENFFGVIEEPIYNPKTCNAVSHAKLVEGKTKVHCAFLFNSAQIVSIKPRIWQSRVLGPVPKGRTKMAAKKYIEALQREGTYDWSQVPSRLNEHKRDAILIALWYQKIYLTERMTRNV